VEPDLSIARKLEPVGLPRSTWYCEPAENLALMRRIDGLYLKWPFTAAARLPQSLTGSRLGHIQSEDLV
jgi:hypothetical protein